jgi:hypothetical protein
LSGNRHAPAAFYPRERPDTHCTGGWVGPRAGLDRRGKSRPPPGFDPRTVQSVASRYTDYTTRPTIRDMLPNKYKYVDHFLVMEILFFCLIISSTDYSMPADTEQYSDSHTAVHGFCTQAADPI